MMIRIRSRIGTAALAGGTAAAIAVVVYASGRWATPESSAHPPAAVSHGTQAGARILQAVPTMLVCMVTDRVYPKPQIAVDVGGRTYYGCCEGCKNGLRSEAGLRLATDPVSGREVDKASAVIGALPDGSVRYFESAATMAAYSQEG